MVNGACVELWGRYLWGGIILLNIVTSAYIARIVAGRLDGVINEAMGKRRSEKRYGIAKAGVPYSGRGGKLIGKIFFKAAVEAKKAGFRHYAAPFAIVGFKYFLPLLIFSVSFFLNFPDVIRAMAVSVLFHSAVASVLAWEKKKYGMKFQKNAYKIYKFLYNQISSGIKVTDAVKTVHQVIDDKDLREILVRLAGSYELTSDIDRALGELRAAYDIHDAEVLCTALKLGVDTGDNREMLARQEEVMFKKYFNYIQAETDSFKARSLAAAVLFTVVLVIMIIIPMIQEMGRALDRVFVSWQGFFI